MLFDLIDLTDADSYLGVSDPPKRVFLRF